MVDIFGRMEESMKATGLITKCMVKENTNGKMAEVMKANTSTTKSMVSASIHGWTEEGTKEAGRMENDRVKASTSFHQELADRASGTKTKESGG